MELVGEGGGFVLLFYELEFGYVGVVVDEEVVVGCVDYVGVVG